MFWLYRLIVILLAPVAWIKLNSLGKQCSNATQALSMTRRGKLPDALHALKPDLWFHGASVGEINALRSLIEHYLEYGHRILITTFTPTGLDQAQRLFGDRVKLSFLPLDTPMATRRWLANIQPRHCIVAETELWPELYHQCRRKCIPLVLVNARLSDQKQKHYRRWQSLYRPAVKAIELAACVDEQHARRWQQLGLRADQTPITGNLKASVPTPATTALVSDTHDFVWTAGSVHPIEDQWVIEAHHQLRSKYPSAKLIIAPRHLSTLESIYSQLKVNKLVWSPFDSRSSTDAVSVWVVDAMGQLMAAYQCANVAYVGGSAVNVGGHNLYEPASLRKPILTGPHLREQREAADALQKVGGLVVVSDAEELAKRLIELATEPALQVKMGQAAHSVVNQAAKSLERTIQAIEPHLGLNHLS